MGWEAFIIQVLAQRMEEIMKYRKSILLMAGVVVCFLLIGQYPGQAQTIFPNQTIYENESGAWGLDTRSEQPRTLSYEFEYLKQTVGLWADGKGDVLIEQHVKNTSSSTADVFDEITWWFQWSSASYANISAKDEKGPLVVEKITEGSRIYVTIKFRKPIPLNSTYKFKLLITIGSMASGSDKNWEAHWSTSGGARIKVFEEVVAFPPNAKIGNFSPAPSERHGNIITWKIQNQTNWTLEIKVPYELSDTIDVPLFLQDSMPWGDDIYAHNTSPADDIGQWGCLTTSGAMIENFLANSQDNDDLTDPGELNAWLTTNDGYTANNGVRHAWVGKHARGANTSMYWNKSVSYDTTTLNYYLRSGYPVILGVKPTVVDGRTFPGHYVVATGITTRNNTPTYTINDPAYGNTTLLEKWGNHALQMILFSASEANQQLITFVAQSPVEFVVVDPIGRKSGYDPNTDTMWNEIPGANYLYEGLTDESGTAAPIVMKTLTVPDPLDGEYTTIVYGTGTGSYTMEATAMDWQGTSNNHIFTGMTTEGAIHEHTVSYSDVISLLYLPQITR